MRQSLNHLFLLLALALCSLAATANQTLTFGFEETIKSTILNEERLIYVSLPNGYETNTSTRYPVLYTLDGNTHFKRVVGTVEWLSVSANMIPHHIVVAITNVARFRDFTPTKPKSAGERPAGGADKFLGFIGDELIPYIDKKYRTTAFRTLTGHSLGGLLTIHALLTRPTMFRSYVAMSPFLRFDDGEIVNRAAKVLKSSSELNASFFMTLGNEPTLLPAYQKLERILNKQAPKGLEWESHVYELETHMSTPSKTLHNALVSISLYAGWQLSPEIVAKGIDAIRAHYVKLSVQMGAPVKPPEGSMNTLGYRLLGEKKIEESIEVFTYNTELYPHSTNPYDSLADALEAAGKLAEAKATLEEAVKIATTNKARNLAQLQGHLKDVTKKLTNL
ncbi:MAG: alpha/beta hydrolase-fold protein [Psychrosphaera sp.]|nr:alpha/beta hydrolase-fold protein [Psychrosphaera sp.]